MAAGIEHARGEVLVTMDGDLQNDPADIGLFLRKAMVLSPLYGSPSVHRRRFRTVAPEVIDE